MHFEFVPRIEDLPAAEWDRLSGAEEPFLRYAFLSALERHGAASERTGWIPDHAILRDDTGRLVAASPGYLKFHSWGEFVFDWAWADAWERLGRAYYPKWVCAVPFTPATGPRVLVAPDAPEGAGADLVIRTIEALDARGLSGGHWLFPRGASEGALADAGLLARSGCQYHWLNAGWPDMEAFLAALRSRRRKEIRRERRRVGELGFTFTVTTGAAVPESSWAHFHAGYRTTFAMHGNIPVLTLDFFHEVAERLGDAVVLIEGWHEGAPVASALCFQGPDALYGRYWASTVEADGVHFETCYYQGIEHCLRHGLSRYEPGAQGEHKVPRGFRPTETRSWHHLSARDLQPLVGDFLQRERRAVHQRMDALRTHLPYRADNE